MRRAVLVAALAGAFTGRCLAEIGGRVLDLEDRVKAQGETIGTLRYELARATARLVPLEHRAEGDLRRLQDIEVVLTAPPCLVPHGKLTDRLRAGLGDEKPRAAERIAQRMRGHVDTLVTAANVHRL